MSVDFSVEQGVAGISLNRAPANAYDWQMLRDLSEAIQKVRQDASVRVAVVRSALPKFFCSGADISTLKDSDRAQFANFLTLAHETVDMITRTPKIFIAAIAGHCLGGGLELALCCDLRFAAAGKYRIGLAEVNLGLSPGMGGTQRLPRLIPKSRALHMMVTGEPVGPDEALTLGILDRVFPEEAFSDEVDKYAQKLASGPTMAQGYIKLSVNMGLETSLSEGLAIERAHQNQLFASEDVAEGLKAFLEKRAPKYQGK
ncbi:MAG: enoyl-CoA hydratase/isomerase family protein [Betaproteobacteria bacterium]|nr:MAG: enoyl-CoA hydratase/isomerase family protein [Betaproteobacteria bacterium]